jgi:superfamily II DNA or RNA helicase
MLERRDAAFCEGARSVVLQCPTGGGKTATAAHPLAELARRGRRAVFLAHLDTLLDDTYGRLVAAGVPCGIVQGDRPADPTAPIQVASLATLDRRGISACPEADEVWIDECHRAAAASVLRVLEFYKHAKLTGLTATPQRTDGKPLSAFERLILGPSVKFLTAEGHLVPCDVIAPATKLKHLAADALTAWEKHTPKQRAIVFAASLAAAKDIVMRAEVRGWKVGLFVGETSRAERQELRDRLAAGDLDLLVSVKAILEGFDAPSVEAVVLASAFESTGAFLQAIGRGLRPSPSTGKTKCTVLDLRGAINEHGLPDEDRRWSLDGQAVIRTEPMPALAHCAECMAIFRPSTTCPRCGAAVTPKQRVERKLSREEKLFLFNQLSQAERDEHVMKEYRRKWWGLVKFGPSLGWLRKQADFQRERWIENRARDEFVKKFNRQPEART